jgi:succinoglycan biosynthesis transport protein ExoP
MTEQLATTAKPAIRLAQGARPAVTSNVAAMTPKEIVGMLRRHVWLIIIMTILGGIASGALFLLERVYNTKYTASAFIQVLAPGKTDPSTFNSPLPAKDILYQARLSQSLLIREQNMLEELVALDEIKQTAWYKQFDNADTGGVLDRLKEPFSSSDPVTAATENLKKSLDATAQRDSDFVQVSMTCKSAKEAALIVNKLVDLFVESRRNFADAGVGAQLASLSEQQHNIQNELKNIQSQMDDLRSAAAQNNVMMIERTTDQSQHTITFKLNQLTTDRDKLNADIRQIQANIGTLEELAKGNVGVQVQDQIKNDMKLINLNEQVSAYKTELAQKLTRFGENHREVRTVAEALKKTQEERDKWEQQLGEQTRQANFRNAQDQLTIMQSRLKELETMREEAEAKQKDLDLMQAKYSNLIISRDEQQQQLTKINDLIDKTNILRKDPETPKVIPQGRALVPKVPSSPRLILYAAGGPILGLMFGLALAFMIELLNDCVRMPSDISRHLRSQLLGIVPDIDEDDLAGDVDLCHVVRQAPYSVLSECYRRLRTTICLSASADSLKTILITSGSPGEGRTSVASNLAATFVAENKKVLFIDTNFRRPSSLQVFPVSAEFEHAADGLSAVLTGKAAVEDVIRPSGIENLDVIDCGASPLNPTELLSGPAMKKLLADLRPKYDHIVIDSPPALLVSDAKAMSAFCDTTLVVVNAAMTRRGAALRQLRELGDSHAAILGCVLFNVKALKGGYFHEMFESFRQYQKVQLAHSI